MRRIIAQLFEEQVWQGGPCTETGDPVSLRHPRLFTDWSREEKKLQLEDGRNLAVVSKLSLAYLNADRDSLPAPTSLSGFKASQYPENARKRFDLPKDHFWHTDRFLPSASAPGWTNPISTAMTGHHPGRVTCLIP